MEPFYFEQKKENPYSKNLVNESRVARERSINRLKEIQKQQAQLNVEFRKLQAKREELFRSQERTI